MAKIDLRDQLLMCTYHTDTGVVNSRCAHCRQFLFCFQDVQVKYLSAFYSIFIIIWVKSFVQFLLVLITLLIKEKKFFFKSLNYKIQILRGTSYFIATVLFFFGLKNLPMTTAVTLSIYFNTNVILNIFLNVDFA